RPGAVRGGGVRRRREPAHRLPRRLHHPHRGRSAGVGDRPHRDAGDLQPAGGQGRGGGRHHRLHPGGGQRRGGRAAPVRRQRCADALHAGAGLADPAGGEVHDGGGVMIPAAFDYARPATVADAVAALAAGGEDAKVLAGGHSLLPVLRLRLAAPTLLVDLGDVAEMRGIRVDGDHLVLGAMTTHAEVAASPLVMQDAPLLAQAATTVGDRQVRHRGTLGGSLSHADPAGDLPTAAAAVAAAVRRENGAIAQARVALTNMGPTPVRAVAVEQALAGADADGIARAAARAAEGTSPPSDATASADYRRHLATVLTRRALTAAAGM